MRISDWSSDVCSSDLLAGAGRRSPTACGGGPPSPRLRRREDLEQARPPRPSPDPRRKPGSTPRGATPLDPGVRRGSGHGNGRQHAEQEKSLSYNLPIWFNAPIRPAIKEASPHDRRQRRQPPPRTPPHHRLSPYHLPTAPTTPPPSRPPPRHTPRPP